MGFYLNPKEGHGEWLSNNAKKVSEREAMRFNSWNHEALLCRVYVDGESMLGIAYDDMERLAFAYPGPPERQWYVCNRKIAETCYGSNRPWAQPYE